MWAAIPRSMAPPEPPPPPKAVEPPPPPPAPVEKTPEPPAQREADIGVAPKPTKVKPHREPKEVFETAPPKVSKKTPPPKPEPKPKVPPKPEPKPEPKAEKKPAKPVDSKAQASKAGTSEAPSLSAAEREAQRKANLARMMSDLGSLGTSSNGTSGSSARSAGPSAAYAGRIMARIKPNIVFPDEVAGNPKATVEVRCGPDGRIISRKLITSSGVPSWDEAVLRAVDRTEVLPADESGRVPPVIQIDFRPKDL
jgi:colicin import membrane protein